MRPVRLLAPALCVLTLATALPVMAQVAVDVPTPSTITTPVPPADPRSLSPLEQKRREALYGTGWQYRMAPISPGANAGVPINPGVDVAPADLSHLDARLKSDEIIMTAMRDSELSRENAVVASIEPGLAYQRVHREMPDIGRFINFPDFSRELDWFKRRF
jgi:hypothetical protein